MFIASLFTMTKTCNFIDFCGNIHFFLITINFLFFFEFLKVKVYINLRSAFSTISILMLYISLKALLHLHPNILVCCGFIFIQFKNLLISLVIYSLMHGLFRGVLFNFLTFRNFSYIFLFISKSIFGGQRTHFVSLQSF